MGCALQPVVPYNTGMTIDPRSSLTPLAPQTPTAEPAGAKMFTEHQLQAIGAAVWAALEEDTATLHERFYPNGDAPITKAQLCDELWEVQDKLRSLGVDMG